MDPSVLRNLQNWLTSSYSSRMNLVPRPTGGNVRLGGESVIPRVCMPNIPRRILIGRRIWRGMDHLLWTLTRGLLCRWRVKYHPRFVKVIGMGWELEVTLEEGKGMIQRWMVLLGEEDDRWPTHLWVCKPFQSISVEEKVCQMMMNCLEQTSFPFEERVETLLYGCTINVLCDRGG